MKLRAILQRVCAQYRLPRRAVAQVERRSRKAVLVRARQEFCYLALIETKHSATTIGRVVGLSYWTVREGGFVFASRNNLDMPRGARCRRWERWRDAA